MLLSARASWQLGLSFVHSFSPLPSFDCFSRVERHRLQTCYSLLFLARVHTGAVYLLLVAINITEHPTQGSGLSSLQ